MRAVKPTILIIGSLPPPAIGPALAMERLLRAPALDASFKVIFLDISDRRGTESMGRLDFTNVLLALKHFWQCSRHLLISQPVLVYLGVSQGLWGYLRDLTFILPTLCLGKQLVLHLRGSEFRGFYDEMLPPLRWLTRKVLARTARMIVLGQRLRAVFDGLMDPERIAVIPNGINCDELGPARSQTELAAVPSKRILYLAHLSKRKGIFVLLRALPAVFEKHPDAQVTIAGLWQDPADEAEAVGLMQVSGLTNRITFVGEITGAAKVELFRQHDIFVFTPVEPEGLPWVILEAMSASLAVVTSDQGAITEVVLDGVCGLVIPAQSVTVARTICRLLDDPASAQAMGRAARERVAAHFSEEVYLRRLVGIYEELVRPCEVTSVSGSGRRGELVPPPSDA